MNIPETMAATIATTAITITHVFCSFLASRGSAWTIKANTIKTQPNKKKLWQQIFKREIRKKTIRYLTLKQAFEHIDPAHHLKVV